MATYYKKIKSLIYNISKRGLMPLLVVLLCSCINNKPLKEYNYKKFNLSTGWKDGVDIELALEIDTLSTSKIYMCAILKNNKSTALVNEIPINIKFTSAKGLERTYNISLPLNVNNKESNTLRITNGTLEFEWPLISNIKNRESGIYNVVISQNGNSPIYKNILSIGIRATEER